MTNLRSLVEKDLLHTIEGEFSTPVVLIPPAGERIAETPDGRPLCGRVLWSHKELTPEGEPVIVPTPVVTLRESSLPQVPKSGEAWGVIIPEGPRSGSPLNHYITDVSGVVEKNNNLGTISLYLIEVKDNQNET